MIDAILQGVVLGLLLSVLVGITFFVLMEASLRYGFGPAISMSAGVASSDALILFLLWYFSQGVISHVVHNSYFHYSSCAVLIGFGFYYMYNSRSVQLHGDASGTRRIRLFLQGFTVNLFNPSVIIYWTGALLVAVTQQRFTGKKLLLYFGTALFVVLLTDLFKIYFAAKIKPLVTQKVLKIIYFSVGILLVLFGIGMLF
ncbi:MAG: LysE family transporter [Bacteroidales bacterium]|nr:LysE family transporter [Bacteroidales bacterium]